MSNKKAIYIVSCIIFVVCLLLIYISFNYDKMMGRNKVAKYPYDTNEKVSGIYVVTNKDGTRVNNSSKVKASHNLSEFTISNMSIKSNTKNPDIAEVSFDIINTSASATKPIMLDINFLDDKKEIKADVVFEIETLKPGESKKIAKSISYQILDSYDFSLEKILSIGA